MKEALQRKTVAFLEHELLVVLALIMLLGILFGYSLAAGQTVTSSPASVTANNASTLLRSSLGADSDDVD
jgi:hypothetical protein